MKGRLLINGIDAYERYGVIVEHYGYKGVVQYPPLKKVTFNTWSEDDGIDPDLSNPVLDTREFDLGLFRINDDHIDELLDVLADKPYSEFNFLEIGCCINLRLISQSNKEVLRRLERFTLKFAHDTPLEDYVYTPPVDIGVKQNGYELDGVSFAEYGISILKGSDEEISKSPAVKKNLLTNIESKVGATYHGTRVVFEKKEVALKCHILAPNMNTFWRNYLALLHDLTQPDERMFFTDKLSDEYPCYYKNSTVNKFDKLTNGKVWCEFSVILVFYSFRVGEQYYILAGEDGSLLLDEDGINYIDIKVYDN